MMMIVVGTKMMVELVELEVLLIFVAFYHIPILPLLHFD
jgi:hypothetical protein